MNYTGPSALVRALHASPHYLVTSVPFKSFDPTADNIIDNPTDYAQAAGFTTGLVYFLSLCIVAVFFFYLASFRCWCCCRSCPLAKDEPKPHPCYIATIATICAAVVVAGVLHGVYFSRLGGEATSAAGVAQSVSDYLDDVKYAALDGLAGIKRESVLVQRLQVLTHNNSFVPQDVRDLITNIAELVTDADSNMASATDTVNRTIVTMDTINDYTDRASAYADISAWGISALVVLVVSVMLLVTFAPPSGPSYHGQCAIDWPALLVAFILFMVASSLWAPLVILGDGCHDPYGVAQEHFKNEYVDFYLYCPPGAPSPIADKVDTVFEHLNATLFDIASLSPYMAFNSSMNDTTTQLHDEVEGTILDVKRIQLLLGCERVHDNMVETLDIVCRRIPEDLFVGAIAMLLLAGLPLLTSCLMKRRRAPPPKPPGSVEEKTELVVSAPESPEETPVATAFWQDANASGKV